MKKVSLPLFIFFGFFLGSQFGVAQNPPIWRYWTTKDGLSKSWTAYVTVGPQGNVWISNPNINRLDGYKIHFLKYIEADFLVKEGSSGQLWTMYWDEDRYDLGGFQLYLDGEWIQYEIDEFLPRLFPIPFLPFEHNTVLFLLPDRLMKFDAVAQKTTSILNIADTNLEKFNDMIFARDNGLWIIGGKGALKIISIIDNINSRSLFHEYVLDDALGIHDLWYPFEGDNGDLYATANALNGKGQIVVRIKSDSWVKIYFSETEAIVGFPGIGDYFWILKGQNDFNRYFQYNESALRQYRYGLNFYTFTYVQGDREQVVQNNSILSGSLEWITTESEGVFWIATSHGLARYAPSTWRKQFELEGERISCSQICEDAKGRLWFQCEKQLICFTEDQWKFYSLPSEHARENLCPLPDGCIAIPVWASYIWIFNPDTEKFTTFSHPLKRSIGLISPCKDDSVIMETFEDNMTRLEVYDGKSFLTLLQREYGKSDNDKGRWGIGPWTWFIIKSEDDDIMLSGHNQGGLARYKGGKYEIISSAESHFDSIITCIANLGGGKYWIGDEDKLHEYDGETFNVIRTSMDIVNSIREFSDGSIWVASGSGLHRYFNGSWVTNFVDEGMPDTAVNDIFEDSAGRIWMGTDDGIYLYNSLADEDPPIIQMDESKNVKEISPGGEAQFVYLGKDKWNYTKQDRLLFSHRIDDKQWSPFISDTVVSVTGLDPGSHRFEVRAMDRNWNISENPAEWEFTVLSPWYQEPAFLIIMSVGSLLIISFAGYALNRHFKLQKANQSLNQFNVELQEANSQLLQLDQLKSTFVSQASHDLRTPLTAIKSSLDNLRRGVGGGINEKQDKVLDRALRSVERLTHLVNDILDLNRIESGRTVIEKSETSFDALVHNVIHENQPAADQKQIKLIANALDESCSIHIDGGKIERVVGELISNAIKYTPENGKITVSLQHREESIELSVKDSGIGMTGEECDKIFERFYRTQASQTMAKGSGLGLSIAKELVEMHDGTLSVRSRKGAGATFTMTLPKSSAEGENHV